MVTERKSYSSTTCQLHRNNNNNNNNNNNKFDLIVKKFDIKFEPKNVFSNKKFIATFPRNTLKKFII
ncbi:hypothetical protein PGB90_000945 [Kerria lacca]